MLANSVLWNIWHPARYLPGNRLAYLAQDGHTELVREERDNGPDERSLLARIACVLTFGLLFGSKQHRSRLESQDGEASEALRDEFSFMNLETQS